MASSQDAAEQFTVFPGLPTEIRLFIWEHACRTERILPLLPGKGHLVPAIHPSLAVPPLLHACSEARAVGLKHYDTSFHHHIYINHEYDQLMLHIFFPHQIIDFALYFDHGPCFNWSKAPRRLAALLDDISFYQSDEDEENDAWRTDPTWRQRLVPFSSDFTWSFTAYSMKIQELTLLVLPPLTARPNCAAHRLDFVEGVSDPVDMGEFLTKELRDRIHTQYVYRRPSDEENYPVVRVRHAICSPWAAESNSNSVSWSTAIRERLPAKHYADLEFGTKPVRAAAPGAQYFSSFTMPSCTALRKERIQAIRKDLKTLKEPFCSELGLGPHIMWQEPRYICATGKMNAGIHYEANRLLLWPSPDDLERPLPEYGPVARFDFAAFLSDPEGTLDLLKHQEEEAEEEGNDWITQSLRMNGLVFWD
ncbi:hypothetical protein B0T14DRAFT_517564 [Immersiella caudata]|uniref:2EXR domain-containing protein n=1 Tax=Immersiella caudata TaxID=314043 RepID=A0AA39WYV3_9PEZI|nr:hypothetical protein B0T14DRAFT_517564 [Immersiella caudata]